MNKVIATFLLTCASLQPCAAGPYEGKPKEDKVIVATSLALLGVTFFQKKTVLSEKEIAALSPDGISGFDRSAVEHWSPRAANLSDVGLLTLTSAPVALLMDRAEREDAWTLTLLYGESHLLVRSMTGSVKKTVDRNRPFVYNPDVPIEKKMTKHARQAMFSGHTSESFNAAVFLSSVYSAYHPHSRWKPLVWGGSLTGAATVGYLRYRAGKHYPSDILLGAVVGSTTGYLVPRLHRARTSVSVHPIADPGPGIGVSWSF